ncbi:MAG: hypothetical protein AAFO69_09970, partial [Bacteroidota bacterium]
MEKLIRKLKQHNIIIDVVDGRLKLDVPEGIIVDDIINEIRENKEALISFITNARKNQAISQIPLATQKPYYKLSSA